MNLPEALIHSASRLSLRKGQILFLQGDEPSGFYHLESGEVSLVKSDREGKELEIARITPGEFFAEAVCFAGTSLPASAHVREPGEALFFPLGRITDLLGRDPEASRFLIRLLAGKCLALTSRLDTLKLQSVRERIIRYILEQCGGDRACRITLDRKKGEIASALGTLPETFSRTLRGLQDQGLIRVRGREVEILDCLSLRRGMDRED